MVTDDNLWFPVAEPDQPVSKVTDC